MSIKVKGNNLLMTHPGGRPAKYESVDQLQEVIEEYFTWCDNRVTEIFIKEAGTNVPISNPAPYTMSGLALKLGMDRRSLLNYSKKEQFFPTIKEARARVEQDVETRLMDGKAPAGAIFNLKNNFDWKDKTEIDAKVEQVTPILGAAAKENTMDDLNDNE